MKIVKYLLMAVFISLMTSCNYKGWSESSIPQQDIEFAKNYLAHLKSRNYREIEKYLNPKLKTHDPRSKLEQLAGYFPSGEPLAIELIGSATFSKDNLWAAMLSFQYQFSDAWLVAHITMEINNGEIIVNTINVEQIPDSLEKINAFNLSDKSILHYLFLTLAIIIPLFIFYTLIVCSRTQNGKKKWLWVIAILFGFAGITLNWTTGEISAQIISLHLFGAGAITSNDYAPWFITISFPLGAVFFLIRQKLLMKRAQ